MRDQRRDLLLLARAFGFSVAELHRMDDQDIEALLLTLELFR